MMLNLRYDLIDAFHSDIKIHPQKEMERLGIEYIHATPQTLGDCWWFWNCKNIPDPLPEYLRPLKWINPQMAVGHGLRESDVIKIMESANIK